MFIFLYYLCTIVVLYSKSVNFTILIDIQFIFSVFILNKFVCAFAIFYIYILHALVSSCNSKLS